MRSITPISVCPGIPSSRRASGSSRARAPRARCSSGCGSRSREFAVMKSTIVATYALLALAGVSPVREQPATVKRPNILLAVADDWSFPHAGIYGDRTVGTPSFDRIAREGARFTHAFVASPSCTPSRAALLTGQAVHRLEEGGNLHGFLPKAYPVYPDLLEQAGYRVGYTGKGWGPGRFEPGGRQI